MTFIVLYTTKGPKIWSLMIQVRSAESGRVWLMNWPGAMQQHIVIVRTSRTHAVSLRQICEKYDVTVLEHSSKAKQLII